jgi:hypothetical protein
MKALIGNPGQRALNEHEPRDTRAVDDRALIEILAPAPITMLAIVSLPSMRYAITLNSAA